jgi:Ran-binding protein 9/10
LSPTASHTTYNLLTGPAFENVGKDCDIYPAVGLRHTGEAIRVNFGHEPFKYDIEYHVQQQRSQAWAKIQSTSLDKLLARGNAATAAKSDPTTSEPAQVFEERLAGPINQLILSYLAHHGYAKTARAFQAQCARRRGIAASTTTATTAPAAATATAEEDHEMEMDDVPPREGKEGRNTGVIDDADVELRTRIVNSVVAGDIDTALTETRAHHPAVLEQEEGLMRFKLRCRKFVEMTLEAEALKKRLMGRTEVGAASVMEEEDEEEEERMAALVAGADGMDVDDDAVLSPRSPTIAGTNGYRYSYGARAAMPIPIQGKPKQLMSPGRGWSPVSGGGGSAVTVAYENALKKTIEYGQKLHAECKDDVRPEVRSIFSRTLAILEREDPLEAGGELAELAGQEARVTLASELNQAILSECCSCC